MHDSGSGGRKGVSRFGDALAMLAVLFGAWIAAAGAAELPVTRILPEPALQRGTYDFPYSVCLDGDTLAFGSPFYGGGWWGPGSVALVRRGDDGWDFLTRLRLRHGYDEMLGFSVVIKGRLLVAGAATAHDGRGGVWLFWDTSDAGDWSQTSEGELPLVHAGPSSYLGQMVALDGRALAVASTTELLLLVDISTSGDWSEWRELVVSPEGGWSGGDDISAVAVNGRTIAVGTASTGEDGEKSGAVHLFHDISAAGDWSDVGETVVMPSDAREGLRFGSSITLAGRRLVVGATGRDETTGKRGAFYVFDDASAARDWSELSETRLARSADDDRPSFGGPVAVDGRTLVASSSYYVMLLEDTSAAGDWSGFSETDVTPYTPDGSVPRPMPVAVQAGTAAVADPGDLQDFGSPGELAILERSPEWAVVDRFWGYTIGDISPMGFGTSVALDGETLMVGRPFDDLGKGAAGSVEVYRYEAGQWQYLTDLRQDVAAPGSNFGSELVLRGRDLLVSGKGSSQSGWGNGGVFVLQDVSVAGDWSEQRQTRLVASDTDFLATSSLSVAFDDRTAFVGNLHAVYVLMDESTAGDWSEVRERKVDIPTSRAGIEVAAAGRTLAVMDEATPSGGAIWIVQDLSVAGDWSELRRVRVAAGDATSSSQLGKALEVLSPRLAAAGEPADDHFRGAVYLFRDTSARNDWSQVTETRMIWPREGTSHGFGGALAASGRWLVVGAENDGEAAAISGAAWLFHDTSGAGDWSTWTGAKLVSPNPWSNDGFGATAAADSGWVVVGAPREDTAGVNNGAVYLYQNSVLDIADLAVTVDANPAVGVGQFAVHSAVVVNRGIDEATGLAVSWELPADVPIAAIGGEGWSCGPIASSVSCSRTSLHAGASSSVAVTLAPTRVGQIVTSVEVSAAEVSFPGPDDGVRDDEGEPEGRARDLLPSHGRGRLERPRRVARPGPPVRLAGRRLHCRWFRGGGDLVAGVQPHGEAARGHRPTEEPQAADPLPQPTRGSHSARDRRLYRARGARARREQPPRGDSGDDHPAREPEVGRREALVERQERRLGCARLLEREKSGVVNVSSNTGEALDGQLLRAGPDGRVREARLRGKFLQRCPRWSSLRGLREGRRRRARAAPAPVGRSPQVTAPIRDPGPVRARHDDLPDGASDLLPTR